MKDNQLQETRWRQYAAAFIAESKHRGYSQAEIDLCLQYAKPLMLSGFPVIYDVVHFCGLVGYDPAYVIGATRSTEYYYRYYEISKKSGGFRAIAEPLPSLKEIQRWILENILDNVKINAAAKAFRKNVFINDNARFHRGQEYVLTVDVKDFFPSISPKRIFKVFERIGYSKNVCSILTDLCCLKGGLPQGAPTSPSLSNSVCRYIDAQLLAFAKKNGLRYTRYADDITVSGDKVGADTIFYLYRILKKHGFTPNEAKTRLQRKHQRQQVTGIIVNEKMQAPRELRREIRQHAFFVKKYGFDDHAAWLEIDKAHYKEHLLGKAGFVISVNKNDRDALNLLKAFRENSAD